MSYKLLFLLIFSIVFLSGCICPPCNTRPMPSERPAATSEVPPSSGATVPRTTVPRTTVPRTTVPVPRPESELPRYHTVEAGENLYRIGLRYNLRAEEIMAFNGLADTRISVGQVLQLFPGERTATPTPRLTTPTPVVPAPAPSSPSASVSSVSRISPDQLALVRSAESINWRWPTNGNVVGTFRADDVSRQGIAIAGSKGQQVLAAADGIVTYQGEALASYGKLLIVKHNDQFLTAYAHNDSFLVKEGDKVRAGQPIATMGSSGAERVQLGFEVRKGGNPVDPFRYLPEL